MTTRYRVPVEVLRQLEPSLPAAYAPDGLDESAIDALIAEVSAGVGPVRRRPVWLSADPVETRRARRVARLAVRSLVSVPGLDASSTRAEFRGVAERAADVEWDEVA